MNQNVQRTEELNLDIRRLAGALWSKKWLIALTGLLCAAAMLVATWLLVEPKYESTAMFYVNNYASMGDAAGTITSSDITASKDLVDSYIVILNTRASLTEVINYANLDLSCEALQKMLDASAVNSTEIFKVVVTSTDPALAEKIADAIAHVLPQRISSILEGTSAKVVDEAVKASVPSSPNLPLNTVIGFVLGMLLSALIVLLTDLFDVTIRSDEDITSQYTLPILASVPDMEAPSKGSYYTYGENTGSTTPAPEKASTVGPNVSFAVSEAYKLLRTKVQFSFADENDCHVIGVSSAMAGEGKSTTAANLAYSLAQLDTRVVLVECDLRRPSVPAKLPVQKMPGLTNYLTRQTPMEEILQDCTLNEVTFQVITSGRVPPNPLELLSSERMANTLNDLRKSYDYIILDLPPVSEVSDALVAAKMCDGILLVVRQNYCNSRLLADCVRQFEFVDARVLGILLSCTTDGEKKYYKKYYRKYGYGYSRYAYSKYAYSAAAAANSGNGSTSGSSKPKRSKRSKPTANRLLRK